MVAGRQGADQRHCQGVPGVSVGRMHARLATGCNTPARAPCAVLRPPRHAPPGVCPARVVRVRVRVVRVRACVALPPRPGFHTMWWRAPVAHTPPSCWARPTDCTLLRLPCIAAAVDGAPVPHLSCIARYPASYRTPAGCGQRVGRAGDRGQPHQQKRPAHRRRRLYLGDGLPLALVRKLVRKLASGGWFGRPAGAGSRMGVHPCTCKAALW